MARLEPRDGNWFSLTIDDARLSRGVTARLRPLVDVAAPLRSIIELGVTEAMDSSKLLDGPLLLPFMGVSGWNEDEEDKDAAVGDGVTVMVGVADV